MYMNTFMHFFLLLYLYNLCPMTVTDIFMNDTVIKNSDRTYCLEPTCVTEYLDVHSGLKMWHSESIFLIFEASSRLFCHHNTSFMTVLVCTGAAWAVRCCVQQTLQTGKISTEMLKVNNLVTKCKEHFIDFVHPVRTKQAAMRWCIWSGTNKERFILKLTGFFNVVSVSDFLSFLICSVLNCYIVLHHPAKIETLYICCRSSGSLKLWQSRNACSCSQWKQTYRNIWAPLPFRSGDAGI